MRARTVVASLFVTAVLVATPGGAASADGSTEVRPGGGKSAAAKAKVQAKKLQRQSGAREHLVIGGTVLAVVGDNVLLTVHGHRHKPLRGRTVLVAVDPAAKVTRDGGVVPLSALLRGDHVVLKSRNFEYEASSVTDAATGEVSWVVSLTATATRVAASPGETTQPVTAG